MTIRCKMIVGPGSCGKEAEESVGVSNYGWIEPNSCVTFFLPTTIIDEIDDPKTTQIIHQPMKLPENTESPQTEAFELYELLQEMEKVALAEQAVAMNKLKKMETYEKLVVIKSLGWVIQISPSKEKVLSLIGDSYESGVNEEVLAVGRRVVSGIQACECLSLIAHSLLLRLIWCGLSSLLVKATCFRPSEESSPSTPASCDTKVEELAQNIQNPSHSNHSYKKLVSSRPTYPLFFLSFFLRKEWACCCTSTDSLVARHYWGMDIAVSSLGCLIVCLWSLTPIQTYWNK